MADGASIQPDPAFTGRAAPNVHPFPVAPRHTAFAHTDAVMVEHRGARTAFANPEHLSAELLAAREERTRRIRATNFEAAVPLARLHTIIAVAVISRRGLFALAMLAAFVLSLAATVALTGAA